MSGFLKGGPRDMGKNHTDMTGDCPGVAALPGSVRDSSMGPFLDWPVLLGMLTGLSGTPLGMVLSVDSVCPESHPRALSYLPRWQAEDSGSSPVPCGSPQALSLLLQLNSLVCTVGPGWVPVFMI